MKNPVFLLLLCLLLLPQATYAADAPAPYGASLFQGNFGQGAAAGAMAPGDRVVTAGVYQLREGERVRILR